MRRLTRSVLLTGAVAAGVVGGVLPAAAVAVPAVKLQTGSSGLFLANIDDDAGVCQAKAKKTAADAVAREAANDQAFYQKKDELADLPDKDEGERPFGPIVNGKDVFATAISKAFAGIGYQVAYANDLTSVHVSEGEIHCATNTLRDSLAPTERWWTKQ